jgi:hypothetical protein
VDADRPAQERDDMKTAGRKTVTRKGAARKPARKPGDRPGAAKQPAARARASALADRQATRSAAGAAPQHTGRRRSGGAVARRGLVVDGTNVICGPQAGSRLDLLLSLVVAAVGKGRDVLCIFDATTPHRLREGAERDLYRWLLQEKPRHFVQCPGRTEADVLILAEADRMRCPVVSNDFFRDREERFPWVRDRGRVLRHQAIRDVLYVGERALPVESDLMSLRRRLERLM